LKVFLLAKVLLLQTWSWNRIRN